MNFLKITLGLLLAAGWAAPFAAGADPAAAAPAVGKIVNLSGNPGFEDADGKRWTIEGEAAICFKYAGLRVEVMDPAFTSAGSLRFTKYRILESERGQAISSGVRQILSAKHRQPELSVHVAQEGKELRFVLALTNPNKTPVKLKFPSSQMYDFAVMTTDEKTTLWRWSWGTGFDVGFKELEIKPRGEVRWEATWDFTQSYAQEGEYLAFGEVHCLPHGLLSEVKRVVLRSGTPRVVLPQYFLPLENNTYWTYRTTGPEARPVEMRVTGTARLDGKEYSVLSFFPDEKSLDASGLPAANANSRIIRFDAARSCFMEWTPLGEKPLLSQDETHRFAALEGGCRTQAGNFDRAMVYQVQRGDAWKTLLTVVPGIGIVRAAIPRAGGDLEIEIATGRSTSPTAAATPVTAAKPASVKSIATFRITVKKSGGNPAQDTLGSLASDGTMVEMAKGVLTRQGIVSASNLWSVMQVLDREGFFQLSDRYGKDDIEDPLVIEVMVDLGGKVKKVTMRTSAEEKPPMGFWKIVDAVESAIKRTQ